MISIDGKMCTVIVWIPARGGSKGLPRKALCSLGEKPLIAWSIEHALSIHYADFVMVNTDDREIAETSKSFGAAIPFLRPKALATDSALLEDVFLHQYRTICDTISKRYFDISVVLSPTNPFRRPGLVQDALTMLSDMFDAASINSVFKQNVDVNNYWTFDQKRGVTRFEPNQSIHDDIQIYQNSFSFSISSHYSSIQRNKNYPYVINEFESIDVDYASDLSKARYALSQHMLPWKQ